MVGVISDETVPANVPSRAIVGEPAFGYVERCYEGKRQARVTVEHDIAHGDRVVLRDRQEQRWITSETVLAPPSRGSGLR
jgi:hypothetical protein